MAVYKKKTSVGQWLKKNEDFRDKDLLQIANEGQEIQGQYGPQLAFLFKTRDGKEGNVSINQTSLNNIIDAYGEDSKSWVGKKVKVWLIPQSVQGKLTKAAYLSHPQATLEEAGDTFMWVIPGKEAPKKEEPAPEYYPTEEINPDDIPF